jgi:hypothetical protein
MDFNVEPDSQLDDKYYGELVCAAIGSWGVSGWTVQKKIQILNYFIDLYLQYQYSGIIVEMKETFSRHLQN